MIHRSHLSLGRAASTQLKLRVWLGALVLLLASVVQATHMHGLLRSPGHAGKRVAVVSAETSSSDICLLCVAMHSAMPALPARAPGLVLLHLFQVLTVATPDRIVTAPPGHTHFSRPPPLSPFA